MKQQKETIKKQKESRNRIPMRNVVYADLLRCYITYLAVVAMTVGTPALVVPIFAADNSRQTTIKQQDDQSILQVNDVDTQVITQSSIIGSTVEDRVSIKSAMSTSMSAIETPEPEMLVNSEENAGIIVKVEPIKKKKKIVEDYYHDVVYYTSSSVKGKSNLTAKQIDGLLEGTGLHGIGKAVYDVENTYGINAYFTLAVCSLESGYGTSPLAKTKNNIFGMLGCSFRSFNSCVNYFGELMTKYDKHGITMTPKGINTIYCTDGSDWNGNVTSLMNQYVRKANKMY